MILKPFLVTEECDFQVRNNVVFSLGGGAAHLVSRLGCENYCKLQLDKAADNEGLLGRIRTLLQVQVQNIPSMRDTAFRLNVSVRTLRRHLEQHGTTWRLLVDEVRLNLAEKLLLESGSTISQIASTVGFADASAFSRAFKRWKGLSPEQYRSLPTAKV